jgi:DNA recombination protein RmuC
MIIEILLVAILALLIVLIYLSIKRSPIESKDVELAFANSWNTSGINEKIGEISRISKDIRSDYRSLDQMLRAPASRGALGEISLEKILADQLPPDMFGIRTTILNDKKPDAYIKSNVGIICIDSKFSLDNYRKMVESNDAIEKETYKKTFLKDIKKNLDKISNDYVCPQEGSAEFAFAYIPSESVYYFLISEFYDEINNYTHRGIQIASPLTLSHKIALIKAGVHAKKLEENVRQVRNDILDLKKNFCLIDELWGVFYEKHFKNAKSKADDIDKAYRKIREQFDHIEKQSSE